jgi:restriction system protein
VQAVIFLGPKVDEGCVVESVAPAWSRILKLLGDDHGAKYRIDPRKWEEIIAGAYKEAGFDDVILTPRSHDHGRDVIATKKGVYSKVIGQCS